MADQYVIVTGGSGYVGGHICKALNCAGYIPINIDRQETSWSSKWGPFYKTDFTKLTEVNDVCNAYKREKYNVIAVVHCAANSLVGPSVSDPKMYYENNVIGTIRFLDFLVEQGRNNFVFSSSSSVYGNQEVVPIKEDAVLKPLTSYGRSKQMIEGVLQDYDIAYDFSSVSLRYFNACGADFDQEVGQVKDATHVIAKILELLLHCDTTVKTGSIDRPPFVIYGTDYKTPDSTCVRDYTHVWDLALAHVKAVEYLVNGGQTEIINLGAGQGHGIWGILDSVNKIVKWLPEIKKGDRRPGDPEKVVADISKAKEVLNWVPEYSDLNTIIETAWKWYNSENFIRKQNENK